MPLNHTPWVVLQVTMRLFQNQANVNLLGLLLGQVLEYGRELIDKKAWRFECWSGLRVLFAFI